MKRNIQAAIEAATKYFLRPMIRFSPPFRLSEQGGTGKHIRPPRPPFKTEEPR